jgi:hypothetical protein
MRSASQRGVPAEGTADRLGRREVIAEALAALVADRPDAMTSVASSS